MHITQTLDSAIYEERRYLVLEKGYALHALGLVLVSEGKKHKLF